MSVSDQTDPPLVGLGDPRLAFFEIAIDVGYKHPDEIVREAAKGKAFRCTAADCGAEVNLYIRAKIGFCNCTTGVSDDDEFTRLSDFNLMGDNHAVLGTGHPIAVAWMKGRSRSYMVAGPFGAGQSALTVAFNDHCDAIVTTVVVAHDHPAIIEPSVLKFLNSKTILGWAEVTLGL
jgi:hypothetical protein